MVLSVSAGWDTTRAILQAYERPSKEARWAPVGAPIEGSLGRTGLAWGRGLHPAGLPGPEKREGDGKSPAGVFDLRLVGGLREGGAPLYADALSRGDRRPCAASTTLRSTRYNRLADEAKGRRTGPRPRTCGGRTTATASSSGWVTTTRRSYRAAGAASLHLRTGPEATTSGCTAFEPG